ncbi:MAG: acetyl-CoA carboxylase biotin carboxylase subunit [Alphaproteobacteria bacterium]|nr:acetyl-CoA carboxylase biotin carboxylase subunit [Alphaproteobacteria bacterium]
MELAGKSLFIANRGEIAVRVNRAAKALGLKVIQGHSQADTEMLAVKLADETVDLGPPAATKSYLDVEKVVAAARDAGADAVHPGYGFLSENARFANAVEAAGMIFVGPSGDTIARMGDKVAAREAAIAAGVPVAPGSKGIVASIDEARSVTREIGYPVMIKASAGGGGRGIRIAENDADLARLIPQAQTEAAAAFGDGSLYLERMVTDARHVEVQIMGDGTRAVHLFERECSLQRRRQKVWEEAPSAVLSDAARAHVCAASIRLAEAVGYRGAGTLEFLYEPARDAFYFMEMNTRIQVEHPVTEMITGVDLVQEMIRIAFGAPLSLDQSALRINGHSIEVRVNAEDPSNNFMPFPGVVGAIQVPDDVRFDTMLYEGYAVPPFYDSLLGKLIVHGADRADALEKLRAALGDMKLEGLKTTLPLFRALANEPKVIAGEANTAFLESWLETAEIEAA